MQLDAFVGNTTIQILTANWCIAQMKQDQHVLVEILRICVPLFNINNEHRFWHSLPLTPVFQDNNVAVFTIS